MKRSLSPDMFMARLAMALIALIVIITVCHAAGPVNVTVVPDVVNVTVEQEGVPAVTITTTVGEIMNVVTAGEQGPKGDKGDPGQDGIIGVNGAPGPPGATGPQGPAGPQGATGPQGRDGYDGYDGATGAQGATGPAGASGKTITCAITGGIRSILYTASSNNPTPTMVPFGVDVKRDGVSITPTSYTWTTPSSGSLLSGSSSASTFTPTVASTFTAGAADNRVDVYLSLNGDYCSATAPVAITRIGDTGSQGAPDTKTDLLNKLKAGVTGDVMRTQCGPGDASGFACLEWRDPSGNIILTYTAGGGVTIYNLPSDTASTIKLVVKKSDGTNGLVYKAGGALELY